MTRATAPIVLTAMVLLTFLAGITAYEQLAFGWHFAREDAPSYTGWHWMRSVLDAAASLALIAVLTRPGLRVETLSSTAVASALATAALSLAAAMLLLASPSAYGTVGAEDGPIEWATAMALFGASVLMAVRSADLRRSRGESRRHGLILTGSIGFTLLFFVMGMEEISWFQRQLGFATPEAVAARNWQGEFNLHNFHTDLTELVLYSSTGLFLMLLPLLRESVLARWTPLRPIAALLPDRSVAAVSAPMLIFTYSHWDLLPVQTAFWIGLGACVAFALSATATRERLLWSALSLWVLLGQGLHLIYGHTMVMIFDSSEYRELFLAFGLFAYGWQQWRTGGTARLTEA